MPKYLVTARYEITDRFVVEAANEEAAVTVGAEAWEYADAELRGRVGDFDVDVVVPADDDATPDYVWEPA